MEGLGLNIFLNLSSIVKKNKKCSARFQKFLAKQIWTPSDRKSLLDSLSAAFVDRDCTEDVARHFRGLLLDVVDRCKPQWGDGQRAFVDYQLFCVALSKVLASHPDMKRYTMDYLKDKPPVFSSHDRGEPAVKKAKKNKSTQQNLSDIELGRTCLRLLQGLKSELTLLWDWSPVLQYVTHSNTVVRWYGCQCVTLLTNMSDSQANVFISRHFTPEEVYTLSRNHPADKNVIDDVFLLTNPLQPASTDTGRVSHTMGTVVEDDLCDSVISVCGILLPKMATDEQSEPDLLVPVQSTQRNLRSLALAVAGGSPVLLQGPVGSGKTSLVEHIASLTGRRSTPQLMKVQLGDQTDSKALLGTYRCTDIPGEFVWQPGSLTQAMTQGHWILLEDIDYAPMDVVSVLVPILESNSISLPGHGDTIRAAPGFQLFASQRLLSGYGGWYRQQGSSSVLLEKMWTKINVEPLSRSELQQVIVDKYPSLTTVAERLLDVYFMLSAGKHDLSGDNSMEDDDVGKFLSHDGRLISTRDLMKWCSRIATDFDGTLSSTAAAVFQEALDCFCACLHNPSKRLPLAEAVGAKVGIPKVKAEFYCAKYKPNVDIQPGTMTVGRACIPRKMNKVVSAQRSYEASFAFTRPSVALLERVAVCVVNQEPVLLVGETGTGKTSSVQYLANRTGHRLRVINMNQQSDSADLLGGFKPVEVKFVIAPLKEEFELLFCKSFSRKQNARFLSHIQECHVKKRWADLFKLMTHTQQSALKKYEPGNELRDDWVKIGAQLKQMSSQVKEVESALAFAFIEGTLVKALKAGDWVLLDEINLASAETLECLSGLLESRAGSVVLSERGDTKPIVRHPDFRLFACMNPATDVGKKDLPPGIRNRFTEFFVDELDNTTDLKILVNEYLKGLSLSAPQVDGIVKFYQTIKEVAIKKLTDGTGHRPHYSLRTLCRALRYASANPCASVPRSLYEGFCLSFLTQLDRSSHPLVQKSIREQVIGKSNIKSLLKQSLPMPPGGKYLQFEGYWVPTGSKEPTVPEGYVLTPAVRENLRDLVRVVAGGKHPILIQGETSVGKTSLVTWLAQSSGNQCVRVNNHEHTDLQEYVGSYAADQQGKLVFKEGVLVDAMRKGSWIILDELNLAPSDVLEALNRLLDDNRELFIPETQETVKAHPRFMLFATQNPPGQYGGRKVLSRAFRNRFVELHYDMIPSSELETILHQRCCLPMSYSKKLVAVMLELQTRRRSSGVFAGKQGFITLRDLFRWAERYHKAANKSSQKFYDWDQDLAEQGYLLLAGRVRKTEECAVIKEVIEKHIKRKVIEENLFTLHENTSPSTAAILKDIVITPPAGFEHVVWTSSMQRLAVLVGNAIQYGEPVLLVGETGCGKTTICQLFAALANTKLYAVNCHLHTESADFLGGLRPVRHRQMEKEDEQQRLFEWCDGPLVLSMKSGSMFLIDEISLADDSVLERLNSVLEPERTLLLAEKGGGIDDNDDIEYITAGESFRIYATMNPGGDYGKKELSPALRNRFTEIWCPQNHDKEDFINIIEHNVRQQVKLLPDMKVSGFGEAIMEFVEWFVTSEVGKRCTVSIRDILAWVHFINSCTDEKTSQLSPSQAFLHGACLVFIDSLGSGSTANLSGVASSNARLLCMKFLTRQLHTRSCDTTDVPKLVSGGQTSPKISQTVVKFGIEPFFIQKGTKQNTSLEQYALQAPTTCVNAQRVMRALQLHKPILLEGSPGVGKTSLVSAIAKASGNELVRINLSEQTDVSDLFGADLPVEGGEGGQFAWRDGPLLRALKAGHWIVLDELNLASQSVLEGLNACLDHRAEVYVPELGMTFHIQHEKTRLFACQNPLNQGGGRRGLPRSFLNRFTQVYVEPLSIQDLHFISTTMYPTIPHDTLQNMIAFNQRVHQETMVYCSWGQRGAPWEFNLRDIFRWCDLMLANQKVPEYFEAGEYVNLIYSSRLRTSADKEKVFNIFQDVFVTSPKAYRSSRHFNVTDNMVQVGHSFLRREESYGACVDNSQSLNLLHCNLEPMESMMDCIKMNWMSILIGGQSSGKTSLVHMLAHLTNNKLQVMAMNSAMDTTELLGGFEQADTWRHVEDLTVSLGELIDQCIRSILQSNTTHMKDVHALIKLWSSHRLTDRQDTNQSSYEEVERLKSKCTSLGEVLRALEKSAEKYGLNMQDSCNTMRSRLVDLASKAKRSGGGNFEWVDSPLVKALKNGHWLLIDNVNFCSPSVLDRLNALLEPNGVLTINERGVIDGKIPEIKPHPNFRLILAMDPKHGEISRAMRNRGVEIYILGENEGEGFDSYDIQSMLQSVGLVGHTPCQVLTSLHDKVRQECTESFTLLELIHAASLTVQQLQRGCHLVTAMWNACHDVYVRSQKNLSDKQTARAIVDETLMNVDMERWESDFLLLQRGLWPDPLPSVEEITKHSSLAMIKRHSSLLLHILNSVAAAGLIKYSIPLTGQELFNRASETGLEAMDLDITLKAVKPAVHLLLETTPLNKWKMLAEWFKGLLQTRFSACQVVPSLLSDEKERHFIENLSAVVSQIFENTFSSKVAQELSSSLVDMEESNAVLSQPYDLRWNPQLLQLVQVSGAMDSTSLQCYTSLANRLYLLSLLYESQVVDYCNVDCSNIRPNKLHQMSLLQLAYAYQQGVLDHSQLPHPVVSHLMPFFRQFDEALLHLVSGDRTIDDPCLYQILDALKWKERFLVFCKQPIQRSTNLLPQLSLHWNWLFAKTLMVLFDENSIPLELKAVLNHLHSALGSDNHISKLHLTIWSTFGSPPPFKTEETLQKFNQFLGIHKALDIRTSPISALTAKALMKKASFLLGNGLDCRRKACELFTDTPEDSYIDDNGDQGVFDEIAKQIEQFEQSTNEAGPDYISSTVSLLPLNEYFSLLVKFSLLPSIISRRHVTLPSLFEFDLANTLQSPWNLSLISRVMNERQTECLNQLSSEVFLAFFGSLRKSPALSNVSWWLQPELNVEETDLSSQSKSLSLHSPVLSYSLFHLLGDGCNHGDSASKAAMQVDGFNSKNRQLAVIGKTVWMSASALESSRTDFRNNDIQSLRVSFLKLMRSLSSLFPNENPQNFDDLSHDKAALMITAIVEQSLLPEHMHALLRSCNKVMEDLGLATHDNSELLALIGKGWVLIGQLQSVLLAPQGPVDPAYKQAVKLQYVRDEIENIKNEMRVRDWSSNLLTGRPVDTSDRLLHPRIKNQLLRQLTLEDYAKELETRTALRPAPPQFDKLLQDSKQYLSTVGSQERIMGLVARFEDIFIQISTGVVMRGAGFVSELRMQLKSLEQFLNHMLDDYPLYNDILMPFLAGVSQVMHGMETLSHVTQKAVLQQQLRLHPSAPISYPDDIVSSLTRFPSLCESTPSLLTFSNRLIDTNMKGLLDKMWTITEGHQSSKSQVISRLLDVALVNVRNHVAIARQLNDSSLFVFSQILHKYVASWQEAEELKKQKELAATSLYHVTSHGDSRTEEEREEDEFRANFPVFDKEFDDIVKGFQLEDAHSTGMQDNSVNDDYQMFSMSDSQMAKLSNIHRQLFESLTQAPWLESCCQSIPTDFQSPVQDAYNIAATLGKDLVQCLNSDIDKTTLGSHIVVSSILQRDINLDTENLDPLSKNSNKPYDFYHDANVHEAIQCRPVLEALAGRVTELLVEWPEHPTLQLMLKIKQRILSFPVTSPLMKMVAGLDALLETCQEWESNAARHVSLQSHMEAVSHIIIQWRKLELKCWRSCLDMVEWRVKERASRWWFHLYQLLQAFIAPSQDEDGTKTDISDLTKSFQQFMENSTIGEYETRLQLVLAFHCQMVNMDSSTERDKVMKVLWNIHRFYKPFLTNVKAKLEQMRTPIEKELKGFVKIARWNDINFWSMKIAAEKTHRTLHKHIKQYEGILSQPVKTLLIESQSLDTPSDSVTPQAEIEPKMLLSAIKCSESVSVPKCVTDDSVLRRTSPLFTRMRRLCHKVFIKATFPGLTSCIEELTGDIIETVHELQSLDVTKDAEKEKQKSEAKHIDLRKRKALADLFKSLSAIGLSYRKGVRILRDSSDSSSQLMLLSPVDLSALTKQLKARGGDVELQTLWSGCDTYFTRTLGRRALFQSAWETPSKDLGVSNLERCKGFAEHLVQLVENQRSHIGQMVDGYYNLRTQVENLGDLAESLVSTDVRPPKSTFPPQHDIKRWMTIFKDMTDGITVCLHQYDVLIHSCPDKTEENCVMSLFPSDMMSAVSMVTKTDERWTEIVGDLKDIQAGVQEVKSSLDSVACSFSTTVYTWNHLHLLQDTVKKLCLISPRLLAMAQLFSCPDNTETNSLNNSLIYMKQQIEKESESFKAWHCEIVTQDVSLESNASSKVERFANKVEDLVTSILLAIQAVYKDHCAVEGDGEKDQNKEDSQEVEMLSNHMTEHLTKNLNRDCDSVNLVKIHSSMMQLVCDLTDMQQDSTNCDRIVETAQCCHLLLTQLPLYDQYLHLVQYFMVQVLASHRTSCKLASVLLGIFSELTLKGFCLPAELSDEMQGEGATQFEDIEGGGLGEGEGAKDVSDQIENEDQLDEARKAGEEQKPEDHSDEPDVKNEDNGIEMSEDFDAKVQDLEPTEGDNSDAEEGDDENELEKQMGDIENPDSDKLDEQIWGGDESEDESEEEKKEEEGPGAAAEAESQMVAKDDNQDKTDGKKPEDGAGEDNEEDNDKQDKINEMKPPGDESEYDDNQVDPHYGQQEPEKEPESMDIPDDLHLDDKEAEEKDGGMDDAETPETKTEPEMSKDEEGLNDDVDNAKSETEDQPEENSESKEDVEKATEENEQEENKGEEEKEKTDVAMETENDGEEPDREPGLNPQDEPQAMDTTEPEEGAPPDDVPQPGEQYGKSQQQTQVMEQSETAQDSAAGGQDQEEQSEGVGLAESDQALGQDSQTTSIVRGGTSNKDTKKFQSQPGKSDVDRSLGSLDEPVHKKLQTTESTSSDGGPQPESKDQLSDLYEHIKQPNESYDAQTVDVATAEQQETRQIPSLEEGTEPVTEEDQDMKPMSDDKMKESEKDPAQLSADKLKQTMTDTSGEVEDAEMEERKAEIEGERVDTVWVERSHQSTIHTQMDVLSQLEPGSLDMDKLRSDLEKQLTVWTHPHQLTSQEVQEAEAAWHRYEALTSSLSQELCEQLRLVLEPSQATKLKGDYRTGKRLNMRKVIPYIASQFRKDKIWLRRTKPSKRQYQILLAVDDSSSMADNHSKQLAFESLAVMTNALTLLESGELSICSFGEDVRLLHPFSEQFTGQSGAKVLHQFTFEQKKTKIALLMQEVIKIMLNAQSRQTGVSNVQTSQLLLIVSDGRGLFLEGMDTVKSAVRMAREANLFVVFVIIDNPDNKDSILDIKVPVFKEAGQMPEIKSYMDHFPFPFYIILRDINSLPQTMSDALRQWFELVTAGDH